METKNKRASEKSFISTILYAAAAVAALCGIALLVINVNQYTSVLKQYVAQGYPAAEVMRELLPNQLLPGILQSIGLYGGIALVLFGVGAANKKVSKCLFMLSNTQISSGITNETSIVQNTTTGDAETAEQVETIEETQKG